MTRISYLRGHKIIYSDELGWRYADDDSSIGFEPIKNIRPCKKCGRDWKYKNDGHWINPDPCLGMLNNVTNACCGHGVDEAAYIQFITGETYYMPVKDWNLDWFDGAIK